MHFLEAKILSNKVYWKSYPIKLIVQTNFVQMLFFSHYRIGNQPYKCGTEWSVIMKFEADFSLSLMYKFWTLKRCTYVSVQRWGRFISKLKNICLELDPSWYEKMVSKKKILIFLPSIKIWEFYSRVFTYLMPVSLSIAPSPCPVL